MIVLTLVCMVSCGNDNQGTTDTTKFVPIFEGATLVETQSTHSVKRAQMLDDDDDFDYEGVIPDVIVDSDITYYATPGSEVRVKVNIKNPSQFEILSLTINETKYQSYQFEDGSNSDVLYIDVTVPNVSGEYTYLIDNIKYIDGDDIEDVNMSNGNKTIKFGVTYDELPTLNVTNKTITKNSYEATVQARDVDSVITKANGLKGYLFDVNHTLITSTEIKGERLTFTDLKEGNKYTLVIATGLDLLDGKGGKNHILYKETFTTLASAYISDVIVTDTTISYKINKDNENITINSVKLVNTTTNKTTDVTNVLNIADLLSNNSYKLVLNYTTNNNTYESSVLVMTNTNSIPTINGLNLTTTKDGFTFDYTITDNDNVVRSEEIVVTKDGVTVYNGPANNKVVNNLLSNTTYNVTLKVGYDLRDGSGINYVENTSTITTIAKVLPTVGVEYTVNEGVFSGILNIVDNDNVFKLTNVELLNKNGEFIKEVIDLNNVNGLSLNTDYKIRVNYTYDLNDGNGVQKDSKVIDFTTGKQKPTIIIDVYDVTDSLFRVKLSEIDANNIGEIKKILLYDSNNTLVTESVVTNALVFENLKAETKYTLNIHYSYDLGDGYGVKEDTTTVVVTTLKAKPKIQKFNVSSTNNSISYSFVVEDINNSIVNTIVGLYKDGLLVSDKDIDGTYNNLLSNNDYELRVLINYDLLDGKGVQTLTFNKMIKTIEKKVPSVNITSTIKENVFNGVLNVFDADNVYELINIELLDRNMQTIRLLDNIDVIDNLELDTQYNIRVNYKYNLNDGSGYKETSYIYKFNTTKKTPTIKFDAYYTSQTYIYLDLRLDNPSNVNAYVESVRLYNDLDVYIRELYSSNNSYTLDNLTKNAIYKVKVNYRYDLEDGMGMQTKEVIYTVRTAKDMPYGNLNLTATNNTISSKLNITDTDNTGSVTSVNLYLGDTLVSTGLDYNFSNLLANNIYKVQVVYTYDLNDFNGSKELLIEQSINTIPYHVSLDTTNLRTSVNSITLDYNVVDETNTLKISKLEVYEHGTTLINALESINSFNNIIINNLKSSTYYKLVTTYTYDALDGKGTLTYTHNTEYHTGTGKKLIVSNIEILNNDTMTPGEYLDSRVYINNVDNLDITALYVDGIRIPTKLSADSSAVIQYKPNCEGGMYHLTITAYEYAINAESKVFNIVEALDVVSEQSVLVLGELEGISIDPETNKEYVNAYNHGFTLNYDGTTGYEIFSIETNLGTIDQSMLTVIGPGQVSFRLPVNYNSYINDVNIVIKKIVYGVGTEQRSWTGNHYGEFGIYYDDTPDSDTDFVVHITNAQEFLNLKSLNPGENKIILLDNDIDFSGIKYEPINMFAIFIGNGHKLTNISYSKQSDITTGNKNYFGVFADVTGYVSNLIIENAYISVSDGSAGILAGNINDAYIKNIAIINSSLVVSSDRNFGFISPAINRSEINGLYLNAKLDIKQNNISYYGCLFNYFDNSNIVNAIIDVSFLNSINSYPLDNPNSFSSNACFSNVIILTHFETSLCHIKANNYIAIGDYLHAASVGTNCYTNKINPHESFEYRSTDILKTKEFYTNLGFDETIWDFSNITNLKPTFKFMTKK